MSTMIKPVSEGDRIESLDILRGIAILGILFMNIQSFSMPGAAYTNPAAFGDLEGINLWVWIFSHVFADQKFISIFSMLFGAGIILISERARQKDSSPTGIHYRRNFWLLIIGMIHAYLIWYGDILVSYALISMVLYFFRNFKARTQFIIGLILFSVPTLLNMFFVASFEFIPDDAKADMLTTWAPDPSVIEKEIAGMTGSIAEQIKTNAATAVMMQTFVFFILFLWRVSGLMLIGMAFYKWGILSAERSNGFYLKLMIPTLAIGTGLTVFGILQNFSADWSMEYSMFTGAQFNYWGSLLVSVGYVAFIMLLSKSDSAKRVKERFAAVGRMALTNYIAQSLIAVFIFFGIGLGLFGETERWMQFLIILGICGVQLLWSEPWLKRFHYGPLEWLWRTLTYLKVQPFKKQDGDALKQTAE